MNAQKWLMLVLTATLTGCATPIRPAPDCALPPPLPEAVRSQADRQQESYSKRASWLLEWFETQIGIGRR